MCLACDDQDMEARLARAAWIARWAQEQELREAAEKAAEERPSEALPAAEETVA